MNNPHLYMLCAFFCTYLILLLYYCDSCVFCYQHFQPSTRLPLTPQNHLFNITRQRNLSSTTYCMLPRIRVGGGWSRITMTRGVSWNMSQLKTHCCKVPPSLNSNSPFMSPTSPKKYFHVIKDTQNMLHVTNDFHDMLPPPSTGHQYYK